MASSAERGSNTELRTTALAAAALALALACSSGDDGPPTSRPDANQPSPAATPSPSAGGSAPPAQVADATDHAALVKEGLATYRTTCTACHNLDPALDGALGPAITGASLELLEARVVRGEYPPGYVPKRDTRAMVPLPHLEPKLPALYAFLNQ